ncbi:hypothetical protein [Vreelandella lionensis]|uniref:hypothetical protein n=1 Tax=Vreelandella lionensis TaxID=1144478 RepID=UPI001FB20D61|nr:hypothetical protein [Halomonas lionensis]
MSNTITTVNPTTGETLETYTLMDESQAKQIVEASHEAFLRLAAQAARAPRQGGESDWRSHERA